MVILEFLFPFLLIIVLIYFRSKRPLKALKYSGITSGIFLLLLYIFVRNVELASTPLAVTSLNKTNERIELYYVALLRGYGSLVLDAHPLDPGKTSKDHFEAEIWDKLWIVAVNENDQLIFSEEKQNVWTVDETSFVVENEMDKIPAGEKEKAHSIIRTYKLNRLIENGLLFGSVVLLIILIAKRKR